MTTTVRRRIADNVVMLCFYHDDLDGRCAAAIVRRHARGGDFVAAHYNRPLPVRAVDPGDAIVIVDYSPTPGDMRVLRRRAGSLLWIDHHSSSFDRADLAGLPGIRESGRAACELAWRYFFPDSKTPRAVAYTADRDLWKWRHGETTAAFCEGIRLRPHGPEATVWRKLLDDNGPALQSIIGPGRVCRRYQRALAAELIERLGFETRLDGHLCLAANFNAFGSDVFGDRAQNYPICLTFFFDGSRFNVTLYSSCLDVLPIARRYGGGGHRGAAGFHCRRLPFTKPGTKPRIAAARNRPATGVSDGGLV